MKHHVVISKEIIEDQGFKSKDGAEVIQGMEVTEERSSNLLRDQAKEYYEKKTIVTKPIALDDLFKRRSLKPGNPESEVQRVLIYGNPGSGKTCITKVIAHKWALGEMAQEFNALYVVPVRVLNTAKTTTRRQKMKSLEGAISQICFSGSKHACAYEDLIAQVDNELDDSSTMLVIDGLDEANDHALELLSTIWQRSCKVLLLSRPYNMRNIELRVEIQVECLGFNDQQLRNYIKSELPEDDAPRLIDFLENSDAMWEMAHIPVTAHILCSLSKEHGTAFEEQKTRVSIFQVYNDMANYIWKRFKTKPISKNIKKSDLFDDLERIAFETFRRGLILIPPRFVTQYATSASVAGTFKESGLLLLVLEGQEYQFPHLTFQEYFAGRHIAKTLKKRGSNEDSRELEFFRNGKYNRKHALSLSFAMHAFVEGQSKYAFQEILSLADEKPIEVLGIQHFLLKMRVIEATLQETDEQDLEDLLHDEQAIKLADSARELLERIIDDVLIREIVVEEFQQLPRVIEGFPKILNETVDEMKKLLAHSSWELTWMEMAKITDVLKLARHSPKQSYIIIQFVLQLVEEPDDSSDRSERIERLSSTAEQLPQHAGNVLPTLTKLCGDEDEYVRQAAIEAIGRVVVAAPRHANEVLKTLAEGCRDEDSDVRQASMEAVSRVVVAAQQPAEEILFTLVESCGEEDSRACQAAMEAIGHIVTTTPQHAGEVLPTLAKWCGIENGGDMRRAAMEAMGRVVVAAPQRANDVLPTLAKLCADEEWDKCRPGKKALLHAVVSALHNANEILPTLAKRSDDEDEYVRRGSMLAIGRIVSEAPHHAVAFLPTLTKGCGDEDSRVRRAAMEAIHLIVVAAPKNAGTVLQTLMNVSDDEDSEVRRAAMNAIGRVVEVAPQHAGTVLPTLMSGCRDEDKYVRPEAIDAIGLVVAPAPQHVEEVLPTLMNGYDDEDSEVRQAAMNAIGRVVEAAPQHANDVLLTVMKGCGEENFKARREAVNAIGRVVGAAPQHAGEVLPTMAKWWGNRSFSPRQGVMAAISQVVAAAPQYAKEYLPMMAIGVGDDEWNARRGGIRGLGRVVAVAPQHGGEVLPILANWCNDGDPDVRRGSMHAIAHVVAAAPQHAGAILPLMATGCGDEELVVRNAARPALKRIVPEKVVLSAMSILPAYNSGISFFFVKHSFSFDPLSKRKTIPFFLHTSFSQEIGRWSKDDIDLFVGFLRQEFEAKFPGLLEHVETKQ